MNCVKGNFQWARKYDHLKQLMKERYNIFFFGWTTELQCRTKLILFRWLTSLSKITNVYHTFVIMQPVNHQYMQNKQNFQTPNAKDIP